MHLYKRNKISGPVGPDFVELIVNGMSGHIEGIAREGKMA